MALSALTVWEVRTTGNDANGGGFVAASGGTDYSQQDTAQIAYTDLVIDATTNTSATSAAHPFTSAHVGNIVNVTGGTGFTVQRVQIVSVAAGVATADKSWGTLSSTGGTGNLGGALLTPALAGNTLVAGNRVWIKSGTYTNAGSIANPVMKFTVSGLIPSNTQPWTWISGYFSTRGDIGFGPKGLNAANRPVFQLAATSANIPAFNSVTAYVVVENIIADANSMTNCSGYLSSGGSTGNVYRGCLAKNFTNAGIQVSSMSIVKYCEAFSGGIASVGIFANGNGCAIAGNSVHDNSNLGVETSSNGNVIYRNLIANNGTIGLSMSSGMNWVWNNTFEGNATGIKNTGTNAINDFKDNIIANCSTAGIVVSSAGTCDDEMFDGNDSFGNTANFTNVTSGSLTALAYTHQYDVLDSVDPCTSHTSGTANFPTDNFGLVVGSGARSATWLTNWPGNTGTTNYEDMGAARHQDPSGGTGGFVSPRPFIVRPPAVVSF